MASTSQAVASYATLILADAGIEITADKISALASSAKAELPAVWAETFAKATEGQDLKEVLLAFSTAGPGASAAAGAPAAAGAAADAAEEAAPAEKEEEESDEDMGMGLFD